MSGVFPVFLKLSGKRVVVVGGGKMAAEKLPALVEAGASVTVIAPDVRESVVELGVELVRRAYRDGDLEGAWYVVAAAPPSVNRAVSEEAGRRQLFVNAVDDRRHADVYLGGIVRRAGFTIAISSDGGSPALTALVRRGLQVLLPNCLEDWMRLGRLLRPGWRADRVPFAQRRPLLLAAINAWHADASRLEGGAR